MKNQGTCFYKILFKFYDLFIKALVGRELTGAILQ